MGEVATQTQTTVRVKRRPPRTPKRTLGQIALALYWVAFLGLAGQAASGFASKLAPQVLSAIPAAFQWVLKQPLPVEVGAGVLAAAFVVFMLWLTWLAFLARKTVLLQQAQAAHEERVDAVVEGIADSPEIAKMRAATDASHALQVEDHALHVEDHAMLVEGREQRKEDHEILVRLDTRLSSEAPAVPANVAAPSGLPRPATLVGREKELDALLAKLRAGDNIGVFALNGMGGIGKSALAAEAVARLSEDREAFPGGAMWISCEGLRGAEGLAEVWARVGMALGQESVAQREGEARRHLLASILTGMPRVLIALDNIEPESDEGPGLDADALLDTLALREHTALLLTARQAVAPARVAALTLPPLPDPEAAELFLQRLEQADAFRPTDADRAGVNAVVDALGGLPLAVDLTAAYAGQQHFPLSRVLDELKASGVNAAAFKSPTDAKKALTTRFDLSWKALPADRQRLFAGLSLLEGASFPREAADTLAVAAMDESKLVDIEDHAPALMADAQDNVASLVAYALVEPLAGERLRLHPLLREYAADRLAGMAEAERDRLGDVMVAYWVAYARAHPGYAGMAALEAEAAGLMGAVEWAHEHERHREVLALAHALNRYWFVRGRVDEARRARPWALEAAVALADQSEEWWAHHELAVLDGNQGHIEAARAGYTRALELAEQLGDLSAQQAERHALAVLDFQQGRIEAAREGYTQALQLAEQLDDLPAQRWELDGLAVCDVSEGLYQQALPRYERALELARQLGDPSAEADELGDLGVVYMRTGDAERGRLLLLKAIGIFEQLNAVEGSARCHLYLAREERTRGEREQAIAHYREALARFERIGDPTAEEARQALRAMGAVE